MSAVAPEHVAPARPGGGGVAEASAGPSSRAASHAPFSSCRWWVLAPVLAPLLVFWEGLTGRRLVAPGDGLTYYLPLHEVVAEQWRSGALPGWDRGTFGGSPLFAVHQHAALHPLALVRAVLPPVLGHNLTVVAALVLAGVGAHLLAHRLTGDHAAAAVAGCAFALCGFQFAHLGHVAIVSTAAWLPWALWAADRVLERATVARVVVGAGVVALAALSGHGQLLVYVLAATALYAVAVAGRERARRLVGVAAMVAVGGALAAVQLLPVATALGGSDRSGLTHQQAVAYSQEPEGLLVLVAPFLYGGSGASGPGPGPYAGSWTLTELGGYVGAAALVLAVAAAPAVRRDRRLLALVLVAAVSVVVALGDTTPVSHLVHALPVVGQMRSWARYTLGVQLAVAVLAAVAVARARAGTTTVRPAVLAVGALVAAGAVAVAPIARGVRAEGTDLAWAVGLPCGAALLGAVALAGLRGRRAPRVALLGLVALVAVDPVVGFGWWYRWRDATPPPAEATALLDGTTPPPWGAVPDAPGGIDRYLWAGDHALDAFPHAPRMTAASGLLSVTGADPLAPADYLEVTGTDYWGNLAEPSHLLGPGSHLLDLLRVTVVAAERGGVDEREPRTPSLPEAFVVGRTRRVDRPGAIDAAIGRAPLDPATEAVVEVDCARCPTDGGPGVAGETGPVTWDDDRVEVDVVAERSGLLVLSQAWSPGWSATVDGEAAPVVRADGVVQAVPVPAGSSTVVLRYRPPGLVAGAGISALAVLGLGVGLVVERRRGRSSRRGLSPAADQRQPGNQRRASSAEGDSSMPVHTG